MASTTRAPGVGALTGGLAYVFGYLVVYLSTAGQVRDSLSATNAVLQFFGNDPIPTWQGVGWVFYNAHFVNVRYPTLGGTATENFISSSDLSALLYAVPVVLLFAAGLATAQYVNAREPMAGLTAGASVAIGYFVLAVVGIFVFTVTRSGSTAQPVPVTAALLGGLVYPLVFGSVGGLVGTALD